MYLSDDGQSSFSQSVRYISLSPLSFTFESHLQELTRVTGGFLFLIIMAFEVGNLMMIVQRQEDGLCDVYLAKRSWRMADFIAQLFKRLQTMKSKS